MSSITLPFWDKINQTLFSYLLNKCQVSLLASRRRKRKGGWCKLCVPLALLGDKKVHYIYKITLLSAGITSIAAHQSILMIS